MVSVGGYESQIMIIVLLVWNIGLTIAVIVLAQKVQATVKPSSITEEGQEPDPVDVNQ